MNYPPLRPASASLVLTGALLLIRLATAPAAVAAERQVPPPNAAPIPVVQSAAAAEAASERALQAGQALVADLTLGHEGKIAQAQPAEPLAPGRYRLHALAASAPHDHIVSEAVTLRLSAGETSAQFERQKAFPAAGRLAPVHLDFVVRAPGAVRITAEWLVGDSKIDRDRYRNIDEGRRAYRAQRQNALNQLSMKTPADAAADDPLAGLGDLLEEELPPLRLHAAAAADLPPYRLLLAGLVIERLSPVVITDVRTDLPAYAADAAGRVIAELRNDADQPVEARIEWSVADDAHPQEVLTRHTETVALAPGQNLSHTFAEPLRTDGIRMRGRIRVQAEVGGLRPAAMRAPFVILPTRAPPQERPKKVFAHYMGCYPVGTGATRHHLVNAGDEIRHDRPDEVNRRGGRFRNFSLVPYEPALTPEESADLDIRRALRIGIDGFAVDAWAGDDGAKKVFDTLIKVAEEKDYPFEITVCLDPTCGGSPVGTVKEILAKHGKSPKLARRDGKPLIFGYMSWCYGVGELWTAVDENLPEAERKARVERLRASELGWHLMGQTFAKAAEQVGEPIFYHVCMTYFFHEVDKALIKPGMLTRAAGVIAQHVGAVGAFGGLGYGDRTEDVARAVQAAGADWGGLGGMHQKENIPFEVYIPKGTEWLRGMWGETRRDDASLLQLITWNDYTENTNIAPGYNTRYTIYDLTGHYIAWWRAGQEPVPDRDRVYLTYAKYPKDAKAWPFTIQTRSERAIEVLTLLAAPATVRLPGREITYDAPAGFHVQQFPVTPGPVIAEIVRDGAVALRLESPEPITDRPFREDNAMVCFSTEFERHWKADFGDAPPLLYSEYGDLDNDGLPNWFEMYWFTEARGFKPIKPTDFADLLDAPKDHPVTRWADMATATKVDPAADPDGDGLSNLEEYLQRSDPTIPAPPAMDGAGPPTL